MLSYIKEFSETLNNKVNFDKLYVQLKSSVVPVESVDGIKGKIYINTKVEFTDEEKLELTNILSNHDGAAPLALDERLKSDRSFRIDELNQLAQYSDRLDDNDAVAYLTNIDNYINGFIRSGIDTVLINKIVEDAQNPNGEHFSFLHSVVNEAGNKTYEYFIAKIQGLI